MNSTCDQPCFLSVEMQELANRLYAVQQGLSLCTTPFYYHWSPGIHPNITKLLSDPSKFKKKVYIPQSQNINYVGLLIGPKGTYQKKLEEQTGVKLLIRGK